MHPMTSTDVLKLLESEGLPHNLQTSVMQLFEAIEHGHTAQPLCNEDADAWSQTLAQSDLAQLFAVNQSALQIQRHFSQESRVADALIKLSSHPIHRIDTDPRQLMPHADGSQQKTIVGAAGQRLSIVTGGPGTGKTTTAAAIIAAKRTLFRKMPHIALVAPTGKAAVKLTESFQMAVSNMEAVELESVAATTIHRQLKELKLADIVLVDEASMVSLDLFDQLLKSLSDNAHLILMGDPNQLASVEAGSILKVISESNALVDNCFELKQRHRIGNQRKLAQLQDLCLLGNSQEFIQALKEIGIFWESNQQIDRLEKAVLDGYQEYVEGVKKTGVPAQPDFQCLTSITEGIGGRRMINQLMQAEIQRLGLNGFGERVLVTVNQPAIGVFNGDIGIVVESSDTKYPRVSFESVNQPLLKNQLGSVESAWAISIHRSQGSEYQSVLISLPEPVSSRSRFKPSRELLYTALTRAKEGVKLFATETMIDQAVSRKTHRVTCLEHFLKTP